MSDQRARLRPFLSGLKSAIVSRDLQDIYQYQPGESQLLSCKELHGESVSTRYLVYDTSDVLEIMERIHPMDKRQRAFVASRLQAGDKAVVGFHAGAPVFYGWLMFGEIEMTYGMFLPLPEGIAFGYNLFTSPAYRRRGVMTGFYSFACYYLKQRNIHVLNVGIATNNTASIKAHEKNGFVKIGYFYTFKLLGIGFTLARFEHAKRFYLSIL